MAKAVFCIAESKEQAELIVDRLRVVGFSGDDISVLLPDRSGTRDFAHQKATKAPEGTVVGVGAGGAVGGALGYLAGIGAIAIPGVGPLIAAGPVLAALSGIAVGGTVGGIAGALVGMGIPEYEAKRYAGKIRAGNILISAHAEDNDEASAARSIFKHAGASDVSTAGESTEARRWRKEDQPPTAGVSEERPVEGRSAHGPERRGGPRLEPSEPRGDRPPGGPRPGADPGPDRPPPGTDEPPR